jgi:hypothetical protein
MKLFPVILHCLSIICIASQVESNFQCWYSSVSLAAPIWKRKDLSLFYLQNMKHLWHFTADSVLLVTISLFSYSSKPTFIYPHFTAQRTWCE